MVEPGMVFQCPKCGATQTVPSAQPKGKGKAVASLVLGLVGLLAWLLPCIGLPVAVVGLVMGILGVKTPGKGMAIAGIVLCSIALAATLINGAIGAYLGATGQHPLINRFSH